MNLYEMSHEEIVRRMFEIEAKYLHTEHWEDVQFLLELANSYYGELKKLGSLPEWLNN